MSVISTVTYLTKDVNDIRGNIEQTVSELRELILSRLSTLVQDSETLVGFQALEKKVNESLNQKDKPYLSVDEDYTFGKDNAFSYRPTKNGLQINLKWDEPLPESVVNGYHFMVWATANTYPNGIGDIKFELKDQDGNTLINTSLAFSEFSITSATEYNIQLNEVVYI